ncbi:MAG: septal ring lytic transglycosylase RlpA family protein [Acidobacteria bacterium]|nr:septal ring lytic transglycosylase RlpA family protein [Acidobacteriota bacterium]
MKTQRLLLFVVLISLLASACGGRRSASRIPVPQTPSPGGGAQTAGPGYTETGYASWYGDPYHGRRAANGEIYDMYKLTAAHRTLPFGTQLQVTNLENGRTVIVRINDRGPFVKGRIVDLSLAGARKIQMVGPGTALVRLEVLSASSPSDPGLYAVQVGAFRDRSNAESLAQDMRRRFGDASIEGYRSNGRTFYRVRVGVNSTLTEANKLAIQLGREERPSFVVRVEN